MSTAAGAVSDWIIALMNELADGAAVTRLDLRRGIDEVIDPSVAPVHLDVPELSFTDWARGAAVIAIQTTSPCAPTDPTGPTRPANQNSRQRM